jgi:hypothetical protein
MLNYCFIIVIVSGLIGKKCQSGKEKVPNCTCKKRKLSVINLLTTPGKVFGFALLALKPVPAPGLKQQ